MATQKMQLKMTSEGKTLSRTLSNTNQAVSNEVLAELGTRLAAFTANTYSSTDRITTVNCDTEEGGGVKPTPTFSIAANTVSIAALDGASKTFSFSTNSDGKVAIAFIPDEPSQNWFDTTPTYGIKDSLFFVGIARMDGGTLTGTFKLQVLPTDNYAASDILTFTLTA